MQRRESLRHITAAAFAAGLPAISSRVAAMPTASDAKFLLVFLRGGYDAANVLVPVSSDFYYQSRPTIAIARPAGVGAQAQTPGALALRGSSDWALHPALGAGLLPLWQSGQLAALPFAGTMDLSRSHFETQDSIEAGLPLASDSNRAGASALRGTGFLNRLAGAMGGVALPVAFTDGLPASLRGPVEVPNVSLKGSGRAAFKPGEADRLAQMYRGTRFASLISEGFELRQTVAQEADAMRDRDAAMASQPLAVDPTGSSMGMDTPRSPGIAAREAEMDAASRKALTAKGFELEARRMAVLMRERFNLGFIDVGGWDTHVNQGGAQGQLANLLRNLGGGIDAFAQEMGQPAWDKTVVVVVSEFGRTFRENGTRGTDHGHGTTYWVAGGKVRGGRIAGEQVRVDAGTLNQNRDFPVLNEYRSVLGGVFKRIYGLDDARIARVFPGARPQDVGLV